MIRSSQLCFIASPSNRIQKPSSSVLMNPATVRATNTASADLHTDHPSPKQRFYFAYGANMNSNTLARRRIPAIESQPVRQLNGQRAQICDPGVVIAFQHRGGFATLLVNNHEQNSKMRNGKDDNSLVYCQPYGVLYTVTDHQLKALETFEIGYCIKEMRVKILDSMSNETDIYVTACVFVSTGWTMLHKPMPPTERYRNILLQGATEHHLPAHYLHWLSKIPTVNTTSAVHLPGYDDTLGKVAAKLFALSCAVLVMFFSVRVER